MSNYFFWRGIQIRTYTGKPLFAVGMVQTNFFGWAFGSWIMKGFYVYNHNLCSKQSQLGTDLLWFFQKTENILVKSSEIPKYGPKSKLIFFSKKKISDFLLVQNVFWNFKIQCVKNLKFFIFKIFHKPHFTNWPYAKIRCKI